ncbi:MAG: hypothetical protein HQK83_04115 [Fibrobacteria bacterium]|nr:hypothetical protein [Fibrobacteria bacterium]
MKSYWIKVCSAVLMIGFLMSCSMILTKIASMALKVASFQTGDVSNLGGMVKICNYNRPNPLTKVSVDILKSRGINKTSINSNALIMVGEGMQFAEVLGEVKCNNQNMQYMGFGGAYFLELDVENGKKFDFQVKGSVKGDVNFSEVYTGSKIAITKPSPNDKIDLSQDLEVEWTKGEHPDRLVQITCWGTQTGGMQGVVLLGDFPDNGHAVITKQVLAENPNIITNVNYLILERQYDEVKDLFEHGALVSIIDGDYMPVKFTGKVAKAVNPVITGFSKGNEKQKSININPVKSLSRTLPVNNLKKVGLSSFLLDGCTMVNIPKSKTDQTIVATYTLNMGANFLEKVANNMADMFMTEITEILNAEEVPTETILESAAYKRLRGYDVVELGKHPIAENIGVLRKQAITVHSKMYEDPASNFFTTARNTISPDKQLGSVVRPPWYYDLFQKNEIDGLFDVEVKLARQIPKKENILDFDEKNELTFNVKISVKTVGYPKTLAVPLSIPVIEGEWMSTSIKWTDKFTHEEFIKNLGYDRFIGSLKEALADFKVKQEEAFKLY